MAPMAVQIKRPDELNQSINACETAQSMQSEVYTYRRTVEAELAGSFLNVFQPKLVVRVC